MKEKISITLNKKLIREIDNTIDNFQIRNRSQAIEFLIEKSLGQNKIAVYLTGGVEESVKIKDIFKPLVEIKSKTIVEHAIKKLRDSDFRTLYIVGKRFILTKIYEVVGDGSKYGVKIILVEEDEKAKGSADTLRTLKGRVNSRFLVVYNDIIFNNENLNALWQSHLDENAIITLLVNSSNFPKKEIIGSIKLEGTKVTSFVEKPNLLQSNIFFASIFVAEPEIFEYGGESLERDVFPELIKKGMIYGHLSSMDYLHLHSETDVEELRKKLGK